MFASLRSKTDAAISIYRTHGIRILLKLVKERLWPRPSENIIDKAHNIARHHAQSTKSLFQRFDEAELFNNLPPPQARSLIVSIKPNKRYIVSDRDVPASTQKRIGKLIRSLDEIPVSEIEGSLFHIYFTCDSDALAVLRKIKEHGGKYIPHGDSYKTSYRFINRQAYNSLKKTWSKIDRVSHLTPEVHENVCEALEITNFVEGDYVEIGVYLGGSALTAMNYLDEIGMKGKFQRKAWLLDTFDGFNYNEAKESSDVIWANTHQLFGVKATQDYIRTTLGDNTVPFELIEANICSEDLPTGIRKIAVANIDVDMYEPTLAAFNKVAGLMSDGGIIIADDPASTPALYGAYLAMNEFLESPIGKQFFPVFKQGQYFLFKQAL